MSRDEAMPSEAHSSPEVREPYHAPILRPMGSLVEVTQAGGFGGPDGLYTDQPS